MKLINPYSNQRHNLISAWKPKTNVMFDHVSGFHSETGGILSNDIDKGFCPLFASDYVLETGLLFPSGLKEFTISTLVNFSSTTNNTPIAFGNDTYIGYSLNNPLLTVNTTIYSFGSYSISDWALLTATVKENDFLRLYINGVQFGENAQSTFTPPTSDNLSFGGYTGLANMRGKIAEARFYTRALSAYEVMNMYLNPNELYQIPFDKLSIILDRSGRGINPEERLSNVTASIRN